MIKWLNSFKEIIEIGGESISPYHFSLFALPGFMHVDFEITDLEKGKTFKLSELSSGEQQIILNLSSISYHLHNLQSIHSSSKDRISYKYVNIILDEIELYYHPNSQRKMVNELLKSVKEISKNMNGIESVNILFSTHSPFILSDIPSSNILRLKDGKPEGNSNETFASNIYDILKDDFFLNEGVIGEFAKEQINKILKKKVIYDSDIQIIDLIGDPLLRGVISEKISTRLDNDELINLQIKKLQKKLNNRKDVSNQ
jgi:hypothetical protein